MEKLELLYDAILTGNLENSVAITTGALSNNVQPDIIINQYMIKAMEEIGSRFENGKVYVPELLMAARAMKGSLDILKPLLQGENSISIGIVVIGTVKGDLHDIGKNLVASMLEGCGFEVFNIGIDVSADKFIAAVKEHKPHILCMSALLTTTMIYMKEVIDALEISGMRKHVKVMVGGAPVTEGFAMKIGADGYSTNANTAVLKAKELININT
jgi:corrinoid protein of di/trimethylamine methyltransferase